MMCEPGMVGYGVGGGVMEDQQDDINKGKRAKDLRSIGNRDGQIIQEPKVIKRGW